MLSRRARLALVVLTLAQAGCASVQGRPAPALNAHVPTADQLAAPYRRQAEQRELDGALRQAVESWMTALAIAPDHGPSRTALARLRARIDRDVAERLQLGSHAVARHDSADARRHFRAALALDPDSRAAHNALRAVAAPAPARPGADGAAAAPAVSSVVEPGVTRPGPAPEAGRSPGEPVDKPAALYTAARAHLAEERDEDAYRSLVRLARLSPGYADSARLLDELHPRLVRHRYQEGLRLFREELLEAAIEQWRGVLELDPGHAHARRSIEQAEKMLRTLATESKR